jgi:hypothetical protein
VGPLSAQLLSTPTTEQWRLPAIPDLALTKSDENKGPYFCSRIVRRRLSYAFFWPWDLTPRSNIIYFGSLCGVEATDHSPNIMSSTQTSRVQSPLGSGFSSSDEGAPPSPPSASVAPTGNAKRPRGRVANVYDAVAGWFRALTWKHPCR